MLWGKIGFVAVPFYIVSTFLLPKPFSLHVCHQGWFSLQNTNHVADLASRLLFKSNRSTGNSNRVRKPCKAFVSGRWAALGANKKQCSLKPSLCLTLYISTGTIQGFFRMSYNIGVRTEWWASTSFYSLLVFPPLSWGGHNQNDRDSLGQIHISAGSFI